jgi:hypothetical protein
MLLHRYSSQLSNNDACIWVGLGNASLRIVMGWESHLPAVTPKPVFTSKDPKEMLRYDLDQKTTP